MSAATLLEDLDAPAGEVWASEAGDNLRYKGPKKALMPEVLAELKARKAEILDHIRPPGDLRSMPPKVDGVYVHGPECDCDWCEEDLQLMRTGRIRSEAQVFRIAREYFGLDGRDGAA